MIGGGISPLTPDFVNPEFSWPNISKVDAYSQHAGFKLECRFPVYPEFFSFLNQELKDRIGVLKNEEGFVKRDYWK